MEGLTGDLILEERASGMLGMGMETEATKMELTALPWLS